MTAPKDVLTTGDVARLCRVTIRTVIKWYEEGRLEGYRLPGSRDRRFTRAAVERFLRDSGLPFDLSGVAQGERRVLVVDDDGGVRTLIAAALADLPAVAVRTAGSGWEAGLLTASWQPHLLLVDFRLGDTTGDEVVRTIRAMDELPQPAIVVMSAHLAEDEFARLFGGQALAFLPKPFELAHLREVVRDGLGAAR